MNWKAQYSPQENLFRYWDMQNRLIALVEVKYPTAHPHRYEDGKYRPIVIKQGEVFPLAIEQSHEKARNSIIKALEEKV